ncbi:MAG: adenylyltransferase/cytidyltransferase family protein [Spirochaetota bacterium]
MNSLFESGKRNFSDKIVTDYDKLAAAVKGLQVVNFKVVVTIGSWDLLHIGHLRYLIQASLKGDILVVGVDTDRAIKLYKGELRPIAPENERLEMLTYQSPVDFVTTVDDVDKKGLWQRGLIKKVLPDVVVAVEDSYPQGQLDEIKKYCSELIILPRQAERTSTSQMIQDTVKRHLDKMYKIVSERC